MLNKKFLIFIICLLCLSICFAETELNTYNVLSTTDVFEIWNHTNLINISNLNSSNIDDIAYFNLSDDGLSRYMNITHNLRYTTNLENLSFTWWSIKLPQEIYNPGGDDCAYSLKIYCRNTTNPLNFSRGADSETAEDPNWKLIGFVVESNSVCNNASKNTTLQIPNTCIDYSIDTNNDDLEFYVLLNFGGRVGLHPIKYNYTIWEEIVLTLQSYKEGALNVMYIINIAFVLLALSIIVGAGYLIMQILNNGSADITTILLMVISFVGLAIVLFIGYIILGNIYTAI